MSVPRRVGAQRRVGNQPGRRQGNIPGYKSNKVWLVVVMFLLVAGMILQALAVGTPGWLEISCREGALTVGLWMLCGAPLNNLSVVQVAENGHADFNVSVNVNVNVISNRSLKRAVNQADPADLDSTRSRPRPGLFSIRWDECHVIDLKLADPYPVWFQATQMLETMGAGCTGITTLLLTMYSCAPTFMALQVALGFAAACFTAAGFIIVGMFNISGGKSGVGSVVPDLLTCDTENPELSYSFKLATVAVALLGIAGIVATLASVLEKGDAAHENRINRKVEDVPSEGDAINNTPTPSSPTPPSTISDESFYDCDYMYPYNGKPTMKKKVSFQRERKQPDYIADNSTHMYPMSVTHSAPHILQPIPRRQSVQQPTNRHEAFPARRESSPLRGYRRSSTSRQDSVSSKESTQSGNKEGTRRTPRKSSAQFETPTRRPSRT